MINKFLSFLLIINIVLVFCANSMLKHDGYSITWILGSPIINSAANQLPESALNPLPFLRRHAKNVQ